MRVVSQAEQDRDMAVDLRGVRAVVLPGTGSDGDYVYRVFSGALEQAGASVVAAEPRPSGLIRGYLADLDGAAAEEPIAVGGVSIGAAVATTWALAHPGRAVAVLAALPAWTGPPLDAPAAVSARHTALLLRRDGLAATTAQMRSTSPPWLADELTRSWARQWPALPDAMVEAAGFVAPTQRTLGRLAVPMGVAAAVDDPIHPLDVAAEWVAAVPRAALRTVTLDALGEDPAVLGAACVAALDEA